MKVGKVPPFFMAKIKTRIFCKNCGYESAKWLGKCPACGEWNSFVEEKVQKDINVGWLQGSQRAGQSKLIAIGEIEDKDESRISIADPELARVLGGGLVVSSFVLLGGEPGIGKSTLLLQEALAVSGRKVLYVSGEESHQQIKMRASRIGIHNEDCYILNETDLNLVLSQVQELEPAIVIIDSIQTLFSSQHEGSPGSVGQIRECAGALLRFTKESGISTFLIGHITKDGSIAGPKLLEHMVDTVLMFEGERNMNYRILRAVKNRFGSASELGIYDMQGEGLKPVVNPSEILLSHKDEHLSGVAVASLLEGNRPLMIDVQSLVTTSGYGTPQRSATGYDSRRLSMLLAVLEKRGGFRLANQDVFLNMAGGLRVEDPAVDLALCVSVISSLENRVIPSDICFAGEVGLGGEVRAVQRIEHRISEAERLGFSTMYVPNVQLTKLKNVKSKIRLIGAKRLDELIISLFLKK